MVQVAWYGHEDVVKSFIENDDVTQSTSADGTQLMNTADDSDLSSDDELYGLLDKSAGGRKVTNGNFTTAESTSHGVQQYTGNMASKLSGININHSTVVQ